MRDLGFDAVVDLSLTDPGMPGRLRIPDGDMRARADPRLQPALGRALGGAHDAARFAARLRPLQPRPRRRARGAVRVRAVPTCARARSPERRRCSAGKFVGQRPAPAFEPWRIAALASGALRPGDWRGEALGPTSTPSRECSRRSRRSSASRSRSYRARSPSCIPGAAGGCCSGDEDDRLDRRDPPARLPRVGPRGRRRLRGGPGAAGRRLAVGRGAYEDVITYPAVHQDVAVVVDEAIAGGRGQGRGAGGRRRAASLGRGLRPLPRRAARRGAEEPGAAAHLPGRRPDAHRRGGRRAARRDRGRASPEIGGSLRE